jgi:cytochrome c peroxidase
MGGFNLHGMGVAGCTLSHPASPANGGPTADYIAHHSFFNYFASTANPAHTRPASISEIGNAGPANHEYDLQDFFDALKADHLPAVSFLKAIAAQDGHAGYSDPLLEQTFLVNTINTIMESRYWPNTAIIILYDDSDGWYDHQYTPPTNASFDPHRDHLTTPTTCGVKGVTQQLGGPAGTGPVNGRCGPGTRQPFLVVSPWARVNYVDHRLIRQSSVSRFIEDNWLGGKRLGGGSFDASAGEINGMFDFTGGGHVPPLFLDDTLGTPVARVANPRPVHLVRPAAAPLSPPAQLGRALFFDARLSRRGRASCAGCHIPSLAYASPTAARGTTTGRAIPSLRYLDRTPRFHIGPDVGESDAPVTPRGRAVPRGGLFWDGRSSTLQSQAMAPLFGATEMGNTTIASLAARIRRAYGARFERLFGAETVAPNDRLVAEATFAIARFELEDRSFHPYSSKYDAWLEGKAALSAQEARGLSLFDNPAKGNCAACHLDRPGADHRPPTFTDYEYEALGVPRNPRLAPNQHATHFDLGVCNPAGTDLTAMRAYCGMFRTPSLRNVATRGAFFHNGEARSLQEVLAFYAYRDARPASVYPRLANGTVARFDDMPERYRANVDTTDPPFGRPRGSEPALTGAEMRDIIAFLRTLTDGYGATASPIASSASRSRTSSACRSGCSR